MFYFMVATLTTKIKDGITKWIGAANSSNFKTRTLRPQKGRNGDQQADNTAPVHTDKKHNFE